MDELTRKHQQTSAHELHQGKLNPAPEKNKAMRLYIDLDRFNKTPADQAGIECSFWFHFQKPGNNGILSIAELAAYALVCRRCEEPHCVNACPMEALEQQKEQNKLLVRHNMRCVSCKSCSHACPYGTIYPELVPFLIHNCDYCLDRRNEKDQPLCVKTCKNGALSLKPADMELDEHTFLVGNNLIVHSTHWQWDKA